MAESEALNDAIAGWVAGVAGILVANPLDVLKVRLQTAKSRPDTTSVSWRSPSPARHFALGERPTPASLSAQWGRHPPFPITPLEWMQVNAGHPGDVYTAKMLRPESPSLWGSLKTLWRQEGVRFLFAGAAGPILGLAFIDSLFFATYGRCMSGLHQDRQDPSRLYAVFASGAGAGGLCAILQTPIEVVKCRTQAESGHPTGQKANSLEIAQRIARTSGLRGFYIGGLTTAVRDSLSSGIFFSSYTIIRRGLRGQAPFEASGKPLDEGGSLRNDWPELGRVLLAGGLAGALSAVIPYPLDIIKTRLQVSKIETTVASAPPASSTLQAPPSRSASSSHAAVSMPPSPLPSPKPTLSSPSPTFRSVVAQIHADGLSVYPPSALWQTRTYRLLSLLLPAQRPRPGFSLHRGGPAAVRLPAERWAAKILGAAGFFRGLVPQVAASFAGSAVTIAAFEVVLEALGAAVAAGRGGRVKTRRRRWLWCRPFDGCRGGGRGI